MPKILSDNGHSVATLDSLNVLSLQALRAFDHVELHGLALLQASESARLNRREMHKNIFAGLTAEEAVAFGVVEPLHCSLFCHLIVLFPFFNVLRRKFVGDQSVRHLSLGKTELTTLPRPSIWLKSAGAADKLAGSAALLHTWPGIVVPQGRDGSTRNGFAQGFVNWR